jgi:HPt (histidine-containing phosphotransfer) domain-containing protein
MAGEARRFPPGSVPHPLRQVLRKPVRADDLLAALDALRAPAGAAPGGAEASLAGFDAMIRELEMDAATVIDLCQSFLARGAQYLQDLRAAADPRDDATLDRIAHGLKGMAGNLRFRRMTELSDRLRQAAKARSDDPAPLIQDLSTEFEALRTMLEERWLKGGAADTGKHA